MMPLPQLCEGCCINKTALFERVFKMSTGSPIANYVCTDCLFRQLPAVIRDKGNDWILNHLEFIGWRRIAEEKVMPQPVEPSRPCVLCKIDNCRPVNAALYARIGAPEPTPGEMHGLCPFHFLRVFPEVIVAHHPNGEKLIDPSKVGWQLINDKPSEIAETLRREESKQAAEEVQELVESNEAPADLEYNALGLHGTLQQDDRLCETQCKPSCTGCKVKNASATLSPRLLSRFNELAMAFNDFQAAFGEEMRR